MSSKWFWWWPRPEREICRPRVKAAVVPRSVQVSEIRRGDRFAEVFLGQSQTFLALEDAQPWCSADQPHGHRFKALGDRGPQVFYCAAGWEGSGPQLYLLPSPEAAEVGSHAEGSTGAGVNPAGADGRPAPGREAWEIVIIAQNILWVSGLKSALEGLGTVVGWTARAWVEQARMCSLRVAPRVVVHHRDPGAAGATGADAQIARALGQRWPGLPRVTITDDPPQAGEEPGLCLPQTVPVESLRAAVREVLAGGQVVTEP